MLSRRSLLQGMLAVPIILVAGHRASGQVLPPLSADYGVASGEPRPDTVVLWTRVPESAQRPTGDEVVVHYAIATSAAFSPATVVGEGDVVTNGAADYTVKVMAGGLLPNTRYYYRFSTETGYRSVVGRTKTAPAPEDHPTAVTFAFISCQNFTQGFYPVLAHLAQDQVDFCVHLGDHIYETGHTGYEPGYVREDTIGGGLATDLPTYRQKYQLYLSDPYLREVRRRFPWIVLWDDHELFNNYAGAQVSQEAPARQRDAYTAFMEYMPILPSVSPSTDTPLRVPLYRQFAFGDLLDVFALDERQYRDGVVCQRDVVVTGYPELAEPTRTMLGDAQRGWLQAALRASTAQWKCLLSEVMMRLALVNQETGSAERLPVRLLRQPIAIAEDVYVNLDAWDGYPAERTALLQFIADQGIRNVVVCTGDAHSGSIKGVGRGLPTVPTSLVRYCFSKTPLNCCSPRGLLMWESISRVFPSAERLQIVLPCMETSFQRMAILRVETITRLSPSQEALETMVPPRGPTLSVGVPSVW
jgi:alkaline phosphatase D